MFGRLVAVVSPVTVPATTEGIGDALAAIDAMRAKLLVALAAFDQANGWAIDGSVSAIAWLRNQGLSAGEAGVLVRAARRLWSLPVTRAAYEAGRLTGAQVDVVCHNLPAVLVPLFAEHEAAVVPTLQGLSLDDTVKAVRHWRAKAEAVVDVLPPEPATLRLSAGHDRRFALSGDLDQVTGELLREALRVAATDDLAGEAPRSAPQRRADALADVCRFFLANCESSSSPRNRPHLDLAANVDALLDGGTGEMRDGQPVDLRAFQALVCDCTVHRVLFSGRSSLLDYGRATHTVPTNLRRAVVARDRHCRFAGCDRPPSWCDVHHVVHWLSNGPTELHNLVLLCGRHHHLLHRRGDDVHLAADGTLTIDGPCGVLTSRAPPLAFAA